MLPGGFEVRIPEGSARIVGQRDDPTAPVKVVCLVTIIVAPGQPLPLDAAKVDERIATVLDALLEAGVRTVAIEDAEGPLERSGILGPNANQAIRRRRARLVGVDLPDRIAEMRAIQAECLAHTAGDRSLFQIIDSYFQAVADRWPSRTFADYFRLQLRKNSDQLLMTDEVAELLALEGRFGHPLPADARRVLLGIARSSEIERGPAEAESKELIERMKRNAEVGVLAPDLATRLRNPEAREAQLLRLQTGSGVVVLSPTEADALRLCREFVQGIAEGGESGQMSIPTSTYELTTMQAGTNGENLYGIDKLLYQQVDQNLVVQKYLVDIAQMLGIDLDDYPTVRRALQQACQWEAATKKGFYSKYQEAVEKAWSHFEKSATTDAHERALLKRLRQSRLLAKLAVLDVVPAEFGELSAELADCQLADVLEAVSAAGITMDDSMTAAARDFDKRRFRLLRFYDIARLRARHMANRTIALAQEDGGQAALICLGFHQPTVEATWKAGRTSFLILLPEITEKELRA